MFFLDYIATGKNIPEKTADIVSGVAEGCVRSECALVGGETAEHPGMMAENDYDIAGFAVGIVDKPDMPDKNDINEGDAIIALPSSGAHSNGFSLIRKVFDIDICHITFSATRREHRPYQIQAAHRKKLSGEDAGDREPSLVRGYEPSQCPESSTPSQG